MQTAALPMSDCSGATRTTSEFKLPDDVQESNFLNQLRGLLEAQFAQQDRTFSTAMQCVASSVRDLRESVEAQTRAPTTVTFRPLSGAARPPSRTMLSSMVRDQHTPDERPGRVSWKSPGIGPPPVAPASSKTPPPAPLWMASILPESSQGSFVDHAPSGEERVSRTPTGSQLGSPAAEVGRIPTGSLPGAIIGENGMGAEGDLVSDCSFRTSATRTTGQRRYSSQISARRTKKIKFEDPDARPPGVVSLISTKVEHFMDWWSCLEEPPRSSRIYRAVHSRQVETLSASIIALNTAFAVYTTNWDVNHVNENQSAFILATELGLLIFYSLELIGKLAAHGIWFFCNKDMNWNILDLFLVVQSLYEQVILLASTAGPGVNLSFMRTLRILKIAKVLRVVKVLKFFTELRVIMNSLIGSIISMFWSFVMLAIIFLLFGLVFVQGVAGHLADHGEAMAATDEITLTFMLESFGSVQLAMLSLFKTATGQDWNRFALMLEEVGTMYYAFFIFFIAFFQIAVINILTGIFVDNALKSAVPDRDARALELRKEDETAKEELLQLFSEVDESQSGIISVEEFAAKLKSKNGKLQAQLALMGLPITDPANFFRIVSVHAGDESLCNEYEANIEAFVEICMRLKGSATNLDLQCVAGDLVSVGAQLEMLREQIDAGGMFSATSFPSFPASPRRVSSILKNIPRE